jgi:hypothetical protein
MEVLGFGFVDEDFSPGLLLHQRVAHHVVYVAVGIQNPANR